MQLVEGTIFAGRFRLLQLLGQGAMGAVWRAQHLGLDIPCAIKFINSDIDTSDELRLRFEREAKIAARLKSPHIVQVMDHGTWEDVPYLAMELLEGEDLEQRLDRVGRLDARQVVEIVRQVARALTKAHAAGLVHRDLKPANLFLVPDEEREILKVLDFGIAKSTLPGFEGKATQTGSIIGSPAYMSPEQLRGRKTIDHRSDLWSLAVVAYECLVGQRPFESAAFGDLASQIIFDPLPVPSEVAKVPPGFDAWWARATVRPPEGRFQSARELADALAIALGQPLEEGSRASLASLAGERAPLSSIPSVPVAATSSISTRDAVIARGVKAALLQKRSTGLVVAAALAAVTALGATLFFATRSPAPTPQAPSVAAGLIPSTEASARPTAAPPAVSPASAAAPPAEDRSGPTAPSATAAAAPRPPLTAALPRAKPLPGTAATPKPKPPPKPRYDDGI